MSANRSIAVVVVALAAGAAGWWSRGWLGDAESVAPGACPGGTAPLYWRAPMDPTYVRNAPGTSPMGMDLVPVCAEERDASAPEAGATPGTVRIDAGVVQRMGVRTTLVERRDLVRRIRAVGRVTWDERRVSHVHSKVQGWVERLSVQYTGQEVQRGQALLEIYSPELVSTQEALLIAARYRDTTGASPVPDVARGGKALFEATRRRLELWDIPESDIQRLLATGSIRKTLTLRAPSSGVVTDLGVREGMEVGPADNLYTIADLSHVWVHADIYERELPWVRVGQRGTVELSYLPGNRFEGEITYVDPFLDPRTRTARVRIELPNPDGLLKPDMFANVWLEAESRSGVLAVPDSAILRSGRRNVALVALGEGRFEPRAVELGLDSDEGWIEVRAALREGEEVVTSGQFLIDSESRFQEAVEKLLSERSGAEAAAPPEPQPHHHPEPALPALPDPPGMDRPDMDHADMDHSGHAAPEPR